MDIRAFALLRLAPTLLVIGCAPTTRPTPAVRTSDGTALIPAGRYWMGTDSSEIPALLDRYRVGRTQLFLGEAPRRLRDVSVFRLDRTEVTTGSFARFLRAHPAWQRERVDPTTHNGRYLEGWQADTPPAGTELLPATFVTWGAALAYCAAAGARLPTEAEWEWAARGGLPAPEFPWGDALPDSNRANWHGAGIGRPTPPGRFPANGYGLYDMAGNVWEYTADRWDAASEGPDARYVIRGGSYGGAAVNLRVRYRDSHPAGGAGPHVGFRCAWDRGLNRRTRS